MATSLKLNDDTITKVQFLARLKKRTAHWIMCEAIKSYTNKEIAQEEFKQEALNSWEEYQETQLHLTNKETQDWLKSWGTEDERKAPICHK